jgi:hypothetical protein
VAGPTVVAALVEVLGVIAEDKPRRTDHRPDRQISPANTTTPP